MRQRASWRSPPSPLQPPQCGLHGRPLGVSASIGVSGAITAALRAGYRLPVTRDLLPALLRLLRAVAVAAPRRPEGAIAEPQRRETDRALPLQDAGTARRERDAAPSRARRRRGSDFSGSE